VCGNRFGVALEALETLVIDAIQKELLAPDVAQAAFRQALHQLAAYAVFTRIRTASLGRRGVTGTGAVAFGGIGWRLGPVSPIFTPV